MHTAYFKTFSNIERAVQHLKYMKSFFVKINTHWMDFQILFTRDYGKKFKNLTAFSKAFLNSIDIYRENIALNISNVYNFEN